MARTISLDGTWEVAEGGWFAQPEEFTHSVPVPGLLDMATPAFEEIGLKSSRREAFWYRRSFDFDEDPAPLNLLRVRKARYGTTIFLNGVEVGTHAPNHTVGEFMLNGALRRGRNELVIRLGAWRDEEPTAVPDGRDIEAYLAVPGIYDAVEIVTAAFPYIDLVKTAPNLETGSVRAVVRVRSGQEPLAFAVTATVSERVSGTERGRSRSDEVAMAPNETLEIDLDVPINDMRLWSPEDPFLYSLDITTPADSHSVRFGMRTFRFDKASGTSLLNDKTYAVRGSASAMFRFFEDPDRKDRPWDPEWVRRLHRQFKAMHWNTMRYAIGFPPDFWYDIADEEGLMVIDEFPLFYIYLADDAPAVEAVLALEPNLKAHPLKSITADDVPTSAPPRVMWPEVLTADAMEDEYRAWVEGHGNHPSVVMWSSNCEGRTAETGKLIARMRDVDLQRRPWGDGWNPPPSADDPYIGHWYLQWNAAMRGEPSGLTMLTNMRKTAIGYPLGGPPDELTPHLRTPNKDFDGVPVNYGGNATLLEEYGWLWLTRDGEPTRLTKPVYASMQGWPVATADERRYTRARLTAAETEFFRCNRAFAGILMFCALSSSHDTVSTADAFVDLDSLEYEPSFFEYVRDAFAPVGLMVDLWERTIRGGILHELPVVVINDLSSEWRGELSVRVQAAETGEVVMEHRRSITVGAFGQVRHHFGLTRVIPDGEHQIIAQITDPAGNAVKSVRDVRVETI